MADITKCSNEKCLFKNDCFRYTVKASQNQSYQKFNPPIDSEFNLCDFFILNDNNNEPTYL